MSNDVILKLLTFYQTADVVPLTHVPSVINATFISYDLTIQLVIARGPDPSLIKQPAAASVRAYAQSVYKLGQTAYANALLAAAKVGGVLDATSPQINDVVCDGTQIPWLRSLTVVTQDEASTSTPGAPEIRWSSPAPPSPLRLHHDARHRSRQEDLGDAPRSFWIPLRDGDHAGRPEVRALLARWDASLVVGIPVARPRTPALARLGWRRASKAHHGPRNRHGLAGT